MASVLSSFKYWFLAARGYSAPISVMSWAVPFVFGVADGGNALYGLIALVGILCVHLGVNLFDDVIDFCLEKKAVNDGKKLAYEFQKGKCKYILDDIDNLKKAFYIAICLFIIGILIGAFFIFKCGFLVLAIMAFAGILAFLYPVLTYVALGEIIVAIMFSPLIYIGTYFVMTNSFSIPILIISVSTGFLSVSLLHTHMFMDFDFDAKNKKKTLCSLVKTKENAVILEGVILFLGFFNILLFIMLGFLSKIMLISLGAIPAAITLFRLLKQHIKNPDSTVEPKFWHGPMENWNDILKANTQGFMSKFLLARNVMVIFTFLICVAKILSELLN